MRVAAIYDIHGNLPALETVLDEIRDAGVNQIVVGGDVVPGPMAREALECLQRLDVPVHYIRGNCEREVLAAIAGEDLRTVPTPFQPLIRWTGEHLASYRDTLAAWPLTFRLDIPGLGEVLFCHATPRDDNEVFTRLTPEQQLAPLLEAAGAPLVVCGHTHMQFDRTIAGVRIINAGSVGMPFGSAGAYWLVLGPNVELRRTPYDLEAAAARIRQTDYPDREDFAAHYVLHPPAEQAMLDLYTRASHKQA